MTETQSSIFRRGTREFVVIVIGVLVALWIDAGWAWFQERGEERVLLADLAAEFNTNEEALAGAIRAQARAAGAIDRVLSEGIQGVPEDSLSRFVAAVFTVERFNPRLGALQGAMASGRFGLLRDAELRAGLAGWQGLAEDAAEGIDWLIPDFLELSRSVLALRATAAGSREELAVFLAEESVIGRLALKQQLLIEAGREYDVLLEETRRILTRLGEL